MISEKYTSGVVTFWSEQNIHTHTNGRRCQITGRASSRQQLYKSTVSKYHLLARLSACLSACCLCTLPRFTPLISTRAVYRPFLPTRRIQKRTSLHDVPRGAGFIESRSELAAVASPVAALQCATRKAPAQPPTGSEPVITNTLVSLQNLLAKMLYREQLRALLAGS